MDIDHLVASFEFRFGAAGVDNARRVTEELLAHIFDCKPLEIYTDKARVPDGTSKFSILRQIEAMAERIEAGEPLQYVIGHVNFFGLAIKSDPRALIPRPETELLVEEVLSAPLWNGTPRRIVDVGTGSGCIICTLAHQRPSGIYTAVDLSPQALELAQENASTHHLREKINFKQQSLLEGFAASSFDAVVANLPYISTAEWEKLDPCVLEYEPESALNSGPTGLELIEDLCLQARTILSPSGLLFLEFGYDQGKAVNDCLTNLGYENVQIKHDLAGLDRIAIARTPTT